MNKARRGTTRRWAPTLLAGALIIALLTTAAVLPGCGSSPPEVRAVRVGFLRTDLHQLAYYVAREKGFFTEQGLDVREGGAFSAGPEEMSAFSAGELDMGYVGAAPCLTFAGQDMVDVRIVAQANAGGSSLVLRPGLEADDVAALKGRTVAVPGVSTMQDFLLRTALKEAGVDASAVKIIVVKPPEMLPALKAAQIDAAMVWEPYPSMATAGGSGRVLINSQKIWPHHPCCVLIVDNAFLEKNPDTVRRFVAAHVKATEYIRKNPVEAADMAHLFTGQNTAITRQALKNIEFGYEPEVKVLQRYAEFMKQAGVIKVENPVSFVNGLVDEQFVGGGK